MRNKLTVNIVLFFVVFSVFGQKKKGDKFLENFLFDKAIAAYKNAMIDEDSTVFANLAKAYRMSGDTKNAEYWYKKTLDEPRPDKMDYFYYAQMLFSNEKYAQGIEQIKLYKRKSKGADSRAMRYLEDTKYYEKLLIDYEQFEIKAIENINTKKLDFSPSWFRDSSLLITSTGSKMTSTNEKLNWNQEVATDIYWVKKDSSGQMIRENIQSLLNSKYSDGSTSWHEPTRTLYFTRNYYTKSDNGIVDEEIDSYSRPQLYYATLNENNEVTQIQTFPYNQFLYTTGQPSISEDGKLLFFTSDRKGSSGGTDIFVSKKGADGKWQKPIALSKKINTEGNELFPFYDHGTLFFASNGLPGLGGLDIFAAKVSEDLKVDHVVNLGVPFNTSKDDFSFMRGKDGYGYLASNRAGGLGGDDIYAYTAKSPVYQIAKIQGKVIDAKTSEILPNVTVKIQGDDYSYTVTSDEEGRYEQDIQPRIEYSIAAKNEGYQNFDDQFTTVELPEEEIVIEKDIPLEPISEQVVAINIPKEKNVDPLDPTKNVDPDDRNEDIVYNDNVPDKYKNPLDPTNKVDPNDPTNTINPTDPKNKVDRIGDVPHKGVDYNTDEPNKKKKYIPSGGKDVVDGDDNNTYPTDPYEFVKKHLNDDEVIVKNLKDLKLDASGSYSILFDFDKWNINAVAREKINKLVTVLKDNKKIKLISFAHTDCRGTDNYNKYLSAKRLSSTIDYLVSKGINRERIRGKALGESSPMYQCACDEEVGEHCSEKTHKSNRRVEFILSITSVL